MRGTASFWQVIGIIRPTVQVASSPFDQNWWVALMYFAPEAANRRSEAKRNREIIYFIRNDDLLAGAKSRVRHERSGREREASAPRSDFAF